MQLVSSKLFEDQNTDMFKFDNKNLSFGLVNVFKSSNSYGDLQNPIRYLRWDFLRK